MSSLSSKILCCLQFKGEIVYLYRIHGAWMSHFSGDVGGELQTGLLDNESFAVHLLTYAAMNEKPMGIM